VADIARSRAFYDDVFGYRSPTKFTKEPTTRPVSNSDSCSAV